MGVVGEGGGLMFDSDFFFFTHTHTQSKCLCRIVCLISVLS